MNLAEFFLGCYGFTIYGVLIVKIIAVEGKMAQFFYGLQKF